MKTIKIKYIVPTCIPFLLAVLITCLESYARKQKPERFVATVETDQVQPTAACTGSSVLIVPIA